MDIRRHTALTLVLVLLAVSLSRPARGEISLIDAGAREGPRIVGMALDVEGRPLVNAGVRLRSVAAPVDSTPVAVATTDEEGRFSFAVVGEGRYVIDVLVGSMLVATSAPFATTGDDMSVQVRAGAPQRAHAKDGRGVLFWTAVGAGIGAGTGLIMNATNPDCRSPDALCPLVPVSLAITGGFMGFLFGLGR